MSRSNRRPYSAVTGTNSAKQDKIAAHRGQRRKQDSYLRNHWDEDESFLIPHRLECSDNDVWGWSRDGHQRLNVPRARDWSYHCLCIQGFDRWGGSWYKEWPPKWSIEVTRK